MNGEIRILMLEDVASDAELVELALREAGLAFVAERVDRHETFLRALEEFRPDIVLADYNLPSFDGRSAVRLVRERHPGIPVVMVTGAVGDEAAVELLREGARDYVLKDRLARLGQAVQHALEEERAIQARRTAEQAVRESEQRFRAMVDHAPDFIALLDREGAIRYVSAPVERVVGYEPEALIGRVFFESVHPEDHAHALADFAELLDTPGTIRHRTLRYRRKDGEWIVLEIVARNGLDVREVQGVIVNTRDVTKRMRAEQERATALHKVRRTLEDGIQAVASTIEMRDPYTAGHQRRVARLAMSIGGALGLPEEQIDGIRLGSLVHDIGKIHVPVEILSKPGRLTAPEMALIRTHATIGYEIMKDIEFPWPVAKTILQHHERLDGSGYPEGLKGEEILLEARILGVADVVEAMSSHRPYRPGLGIQVALAEITSFRGIRYEPRAVDACLQLFEEGFAFGD